MIAVVESSFRARVRDAFRLQPSQPGDLWLFYRFIGIAAGALTTLGLLLWFAGRGDAHGHGGIFGFIIAAYCVVPAAMFLFSARQLRRARAPSWVHVWVPVVVVAAWTYVSGRVLRI